jgi:DNA helicase-2/ATP-dependent DNA helicase PcrA
VTEIELNESYRSSPAVLRAVNVLAAQMGVTELQCGDPENWPDEGQVLVVTSATTQDEAISLLGFVDSISTGDPISVGVVARRGTRLDDLRRCATERGDDFYDWSAPTHVARVVDLLKRKLPEATDDNTTQQVRTLERLCLQTVEPADADTRDEVVAACDALRLMIEQGATLVEAVGQCRSSPDPDAPVVPGLHLLTGHLGKGQEFDWVIVVGLEEGHVPDFRSTQGAALAEELRVLHVMVSRARYGVVVTSSRATRTRYGWRQATPSPWFELLAGAATAEITW